MAHDELTEKQRAAIQAREAANTELAQARERIVQLEAELSTRITAAEAKSLEREVTLLRRNAADAEALTAERNKSRQSAWAWKYAAELQAGRVKVLENAAAKTEQARIEGMVWGWAAGVLEGVGDCDGDRHHSEAEVIGGVVYVRTYPADEEGGVEWERPLSDFTGESAP